MKIQERKELLRELGIFMAAEDDAWQRAKEKAAAENAWFIPAFIDRSVQNIAQRFLSPAALQNLVDRYGIGEPASPKKIGIVAAGNVPLVGFHDLLCTFLTGHWAVVKPSSKDTVLLTFLLDKMKALNPAAVPYLTVGERLTGCDAYIATGSNNSSGYFDYYFGRYPHIIRKARTSVAVLTGRESNAELEALAADVYLYFGLGCRNVTKLYVPRGYHFEPLLNAFKKYNYLADYSKYKNNYDYNFAVLLLNHQPYMSNESLLLVEEPSLFSPIAQLNYEYYDDAEALLQFLRQNENVQCVVGAGNLAYGTAQQPGVCDFADGVDTVAFLQGLTEVRRS